MNSVERFGAIVSLAAVIASVAVTFGIQMERLSHLMEEMKELRISQEELRSQQERVMQAIGEMEHRRWKEKRR